MFIESWELAGRDTAPLRNIHVGPAIHHESDADFIIRHDRFYQGYSFISILRIDISVSMNGSSQFHIVMCSIPLRITFS